jgi:hypothetical protein
MLNAKKCIRTYQVARDFGMMVPTAWKIMHKIRKAMEARRPLQKNLKTLLEYTNI